MCAPVCVLVCVRAGSNNCDASANGGCTLPSGAQGICTDNRGCINEFCHNCPDGDCECRENDRTGRCNESGECLIQNPNNGCQEEGADCESSDGIVGRCRPSSSGALFCQIENNTGGSRHAGCDNTQEQEAPDESGKIIKRDIY